MIRAVLQRQGKKEIHVAGQGMETAINPGERLKLCL
jgi:hypothetical protein